jgi:hypothetical protein
LIDEWELVGASLLKLVFFNITWHNGDFGPTVVALCMDILRAMVPVALSQYIGAGPVLRS